MSDTLSSIIEKYSQAKEYQKPKMDKYLDWYAIYRNQDRKSDPDVPSKVFEPVAWSFIEIITTRMLAKKPTIAFKARATSSEAQARLLSDIHSYWFDKSQSFPKYVKAVKEGLIYGTGIVKVDWKTTAPRKVRSYVMGQDGRPMPKMQVAEDGTMTPLPEFDVKEELVVDYDDPIVTNVSPYSFYIEPGAPSLDDARWCIHVYDTTLAELENLQRAAKRRGVYLYKDAGLKKLRDMKSAELSPEENSRAQLSGWNNADFKSKDKVRLIEYWEDTKYCVVANDSVLLREGDNPYWHGRKPFAYWNDSIVPQEFFGVGEIEPIEGPIHAINTVQNQRITNVNRVLNPKLMVTGSVEDSEIDFDLPGPIHMKVGDTISPLVIPDVTGTAARDKQIMVSAIQNALGVTDAIQGMSGVGETAKEVEIRTAQANTRFSHKLKLFEDMFLKRVAELVLDLYKQFLTSDRIMRIQGDQGEELITFTPADLIGEYDVVPESESTLEVDNMGNFQKFAHFSQFLQPWIKRQQQTPDGQIIETGLISDEAILREGIRQYGDDANKYLSNSEDGQMTGDVMPVKDQKIDPQDFLAMLQDGR